MKGFRVDFLERREIHFDRSREDGAFAVEDPETGFITIDSARLTRTGVFIYSDGIDVWGELRLEEEVFHPDSIASFDPVVLTDDHPERFVSTENVKDVQVGTVSNVRRDGNFLVGKIQITDAETIRKVRAGKQELSCGYQANGEESGGIRDGLSYQRIQRSIRGNHVSIVDRGRAGPDCRIMIADSVGSGVAFTIEGKAMTKTKKIKIDGVEFELPTETADAIEASRATKTKTITKDGKEYLVPSEIADMFGTEEEEEEDKKDSDELERLRGKNDALENRLRTLESSQESKIDERVNLIRKAGEVLGSDFVADGQSNVSIKRAVIKVLQPETKTEGRSDAYLDGLFDAAIEQHKTKIADSNSTQIFDSIKSGVSDSIEDVIKISDSFFESRKNIGRRTQTEN
jgi:uncharacterized protein